MSMHFPTSLPHPGGSPSASTHFLIQQTRPVRYPIRRKTQPKAALPACSSQPVAEDSDDAPLLQPTAAHRRAESVATHPTATSSTQTKNASSTYVTARVDGPLSSIEGSLHSKLTAGHVGAHNLKVKTSRLFGKKSHSPDEEAHSPTEASEFYAMKHEKAVATQLAEQEEVEKRRILSPPSRLTAMLKRGKSDAEKQVSLDNGEHHPLEGARQRMIQQRERKMRRAFGGSKLSKNSHSPAGESKGSHGNKDKKAAADVEVPKMSGAIIPGEQRLDAEARASRASEKFKQMSRHFGTPKVSHAAVPSEQRMEAEFRASRASEKFKQIRHHLRSSKDGKDGRRQGSGEDLVFSFHCERENFETVTRADGKVVAIPPRAADYQEVPPVFNAEVSTLPDVTLYGVPPAISTLNSQIYPPRLAAPFFRPTLSPVSSRSALLTTAAPTRSNTEKGTTISPKAVSAHGQSAVDRSSVKQTQHYSDSSKISVHLPLPEISAPQPRRNSFQAVQKLQSQEDLSEPESPTVVQPKVLSPIQETFSPPPTLPSKHDLPDSLRIHVPLVPTQSISSEFLADPQQSRKQASKTIIFQSPLLEKIEYTPEESPLSPPGVIENDSPESPESLHEKLMTTMRTPGSSAVSFWKDADESIHPSDSASFQIPNRFGQPPPKFWKAADLSMKDRKAGPCMGEWIASLPRLGLGLGPWGASDGAIDVKCFNKMKASLKEKKKGGRDSKGSGSSKVSATTQEMIERNMDGYDRTVERVNAIAEKSMKEAAEALMRAEEAMGVLEEEWVTAGRRDKGSAHSSYIHGNSVSTRVKEEYKLSHPKLSTVGPTAPKSKLGRDLVFRLQELEKYWEQQEVAAGAVMKKMLVAVDNILVKEREEAQRQQRRREMGWYDGDDSGDDNEEPEKPQAAPPVKVRARMPELSSKPSCSVA